MANQIRNFFKSFDFFDKPFAFFVGEKKKKSTFIGGFLSISIIILSVSYFYYLIDLYFANKFEPKITSSISIEDEIFSLNIAEDSFIFEFLVNGEPLKQFEKRQGKTYLTYLVTYDSSDPINGVYSHIKMPLVECQNTKFKGFLCMNSSSISSQKIQMDTVKNTWSQYTLKIGFCDNSTISNCATEKEIQDLALNENNFMQFYTKIRQYSSDIRDYKEGYKSEYMLFDPNLVLYTRMSLIKSSTTVTQGMVIQHSSSEDIFDYKRIDAYYSKENAILNQHFYGYAVIIFENNQMRNIISIQHAMVTEVLAQFMGVINPLLIVGILARMLAASQIIEDINNILLKEYYKQTALKLVNQREDKAQTSKNQKQLPKPQQEMKRIDQSAAIVQLSKKLNQSNFAEESRHYFQMSYFNRAKIFLGKLLGRNINLSAKEQGSDSMVYEQIFKQSMKRINIFEVYKDIIKMKMFIKLMLSKEQFATMQFCGSEIREKQTILPQVYTPSQTKQRKSKNTHNLEKEGTLPNIGSSSSQKSNCFFTRSNVPSHEIDKNKNQKRYSKDVKQVDYPIDKSSNKITQLQTNQGDSQAPNNKIQLKSDQETENVQNNLFESDNILDILEKQPKQIDNIIILKKNKKDNCLGF